MQKARLSDNHALVITQQRGSIRGLVVFWSIFAIASIFGIFLEFALLQKSVLLNSYASIVRLSFVLLLCSILYLLYRALIYNRSIALDQDAIRIDGSFGRSLLALDHVSAIEIFFDRDAFSLVAETYSAEKIRLLSFSRITAAEETAHIVRKHVRQFQTKFENPQYHPIGTAGSIRGEINSRIFSVNGPPSISLDVALR